MIPLYGQIAVTGTAQRLTTGNQPELSGWTIKAPRSNAHPVFIGDANVTLSNGYQLDPGDEMQYEPFIQNGMPRYNLKPADFYAVGTSGDVVSWLASP